MSRTSKDYNITHNCGHQQWHEVSGWDSKGRARRVAELESLPCDACWKVQRQQLIEDEAKAAELAMAQERAALPEDLRDNAMASEDVEDVVTFVALHAARAGRKPLPWSYPSGPAISGVLVEAPDAEGVPWYAGVAYEDGYSFPIDGEVRTTPTRLRRDLADVLASAPTDCERHIAITDDGTRIVWQDMRR